MTDDPKPLSPDDDASSDSKQVPKKSGLSRRRFIASAAGTAATALIGLPEAAGAAQGSVQRQYRIHPAIGVARVGNADPSSYFIGPEAPGFGPLGDAPGTSPVPKKVNGQVKPQAARFRIFEYQMDSSGLWQPVGEVNLNSANVVSINWAVHLANKKASFNQFGGPAGESTPPLPLRNGSVTSNRQQLLEIDFGARQISGPGAAPVIFQPSGAAGETYPKKPDGVTPVINYLGQLRTDSYGRLIVIGGKGQAGYNTATMPALTTYANNDNWFDDISDGPVTAQITIQTAPGVYTTFSALGAWVLVAPPDFAPPVSNAVSMYDLLYDLAVRKIPVPTNNGLFAAGGPLARLTQLQNTYAQGQPVEFPGIMPDFDSEVHPILLNGYNYYFVDNAVPVKHSSLIDPTLGNTSPAYNSNRQFVLGYMRPPVGITGPSGKKTMPHILGDDPYNSHADQSIQNLVLTHTQYGMLTNWATGAFVGAGNGPAPTSAITPWGLDRAALENCVGGAFFPGIEASWQIRGPGLYLEPFRINLNANSQYYGESGTIQPGHFSRQMAVPWHADFNDCRNESTNSWWPGQRPQSVYVQSSQTRIDWARPDSKFASGGQTSSHLDMLNNWYKFGFVALSPDGTAFIETERNSGIG